MSDPQAADRDQGANAFRDLTTPPMPRRLRAAALAHALRVAPPPPEKLADAAPVVAKLQALLELMRARE